MATESHAYHEMKMPARSKKPAKVLDHMRVMPAENAGAIIEHHFTKFEHEPERHVFGKEEGAKMAAHVMKHAGMAAKDMEDSEDVGDRTEDARHDNKSED